MQPKECLINSKDYSSNTIYYYPVTEIDQETEMRLGRDHYHPHFILMICGGYVSTL